MSVDLLFALPERVTVAEAASLARDAVTRLRAAQGALRVDAAGLRHFDSTCLALLLELRRAAGARRIDVIAAPQRLLHLAEAYGVGFLFAEAEA